MFFRCCLQYLIHSVTLFCTVFGASIAILGYLNFISHMHNVKLSNFFHTLGITLMVIGTVITILSFTGLLGNLCRNRCLLITFSTLMIVLLLVEFLVVIAAFSLYNEETLSEELKSSLQYYNEEKDIKKFWDLINSKLECCGIDSVDDWHDNMPNSCCKDLNINDICHKELANETPCLPKIVEVLKTKIPVGLSLIFGVQLFCIIVPFTLSRF